MNKYRESILYIIIGVLTTAVNFLVYIIGTRVLMVNVIIVNIFAWLMAVLFSFFANRSIVFISKDEKIFKQVFKYFVSRLVSGAVEQILFVSLLYQDVFKDITIKILISIIIILLNFITSKYIVFNTKEKK